MTDIDPIGHVNNSVQLSYYDLGRLKYLETIQQKEVVWQELDMVIVHTSCDFINSIFINNTIAVETKIIAIGEKSIKMLQRIIDITTNEIKSTCYSIMSGYDKENNCSKQIAEHLKNKILAFEK